MEKGNFEGMSVGRYTQSDAAPVWCGCRLGCTIGATWRIRLNFPRAAAMRHYVRLLRPLVFFLAHPPTFQTLPPPATTTATIERVQALADISRSRKRNPCTDCKSAICATTGHPHHFRSLHPGPCSSVGMRRGTYRHTQRDIHTDARDQYTFRVVYDSREMYNYYYDY